VSGIRLRHRFMAGYMAWIVMCLCASVSTAQEVIQLTESQKEYNDRGVQLILEGEYEEAIGMLLSSLQLGDVNVTYLNLGRAYFHAGRCDASRQAYMKAELAPAVETPSLADFAELLGRFRQDLEGRCTSKIRFRCFPGNVTVRLPGRAPVSCQDSINVIPGRYEVLGQWGEEKVGKEVEVLELEEAFVEFDFVPRVKLTERLGWIGVFTGGALVLASIANDQWNLSAKVEELERVSSGGDVSRYNELYDDVTFAQNFNRVLFLSGALIGSAGAVLLVWPNQDSGRMASRSGDWYVGWVGSF
jgi:hypothetical protein